MARKKKKRLGRGKLYKTRSEARDARDKQAGRNYLKQVKGGWKVYRQK